MIRLCGMPVITGDIKKGTVDFSTSLSSLTKKGPWAAGTADGPCIAIFWLLNYSWEITLADPSMLVHHQKWLFVLQLI